jgi:NAD(P)-dependent dehydrogenase (short-subunit alcohol dehydrogenase family)
MPVISRRNFVHNFHHDTYPALQSKLNSISLTNKSAWITGSGSGIGRATALAFARAGARALFLSGRTAATLESTKRLIENANTKTKVYVFIFDISAGLEKVDEVFAEVARLDGGNGVDILVNNAADLAAIPTVVPAGPEDDLAPSLANFDRYWRHFEVNVRGSLALATAFLRNASASPTIINTTSGAAVIDFVPGLSGYGVSKMAALKMFSYLWYENQVENGGSGLKVYHIHPGIVPSAMASEGNSKTEDTGEYLSNFQAIRD